MRSRLWTLILRELPFPFREIGTEIVRCATWVDRTAARIWLSLAKSPAWYAVTMAGAVAFGLTFLLFFTFISAHDPTLGQIAARTRISAPSITRELMEAEGRWEAQDKWRIAHMFVEHRKAKPSSSRFADLDLTDEFIVPVPRPSRNRPVNDRYASTFTPDPYAPSKSARQIQPEVDVRLDLAAPKRAEQPKRLVYGQLVRDSGHYYQPTRTATHYKSRESRLLVQAEWSFASDCCNEPPRRPITRRIIPVPQPQWDDYPPIEREEPDRRHPDLAFTMHLLREFLPDGSEFPDQSHINTVTAHSQLPEVIQSRHRSPFDSASDSPWSRTQPGRHKHQEMASRGAGLLEPDQLDPHTHEHSIPASAPSYAELALKLNLNVPEEAAVGTVAQSSLVIQNEGTAAISRVQVREPVSRLETILDANPAAVVHAEENFVEREIRHLEPGKGRRLELVWRPESEGEFRYRAIVSVEAFVGATTEVIAQQTPAIPEPEPVEQPMPSIAPEEIPVQPVPVKENPKLSFDVRHQPRATVDDMVEFQIVVRNTGDVALHHVRVHAQLPTELKHRRGSEVDFVVEQIPVGGSQVAILRVLAGSAGKAVCRLVASADEPVESKSTAVVDISAPAPRVVQPLPKPVPTPAPRQPAPTPIAKVTPPKPVAPKRPATPQGNCCCQSPPDDMYMPWWID